MDRQDRIENAFWLFDDERKRTGAERDAFKNQVSQVLTCGDAEVNWSYDMVWVNFPGDIQADGEPKCFSSSLENPERLGEMIKDLLEYVGVKAVVKED